MLGLDVASLTVSTLHRAPLRKGILHMSEDGYASPRDVEKQAKRWSNEMLECRSYGHLWRPQVAQHLKRLGYWFIIRKCSRCGTERHEEINERGTVFSSWYKYADGYLVDGLGRITGDGRGVLRMETIMRTFTVQTLTGAAAAAMKPHSKHTREAIGWTD